MRKHGFDLEEGTWRVAETSMGERDPLNDAVVGAVSSPRLAGPALMPRSARHCHVVTCLLEAHIGFQHTHFRPKLSATEALSMKPANLSTPPPPGELDRRSRLMSSGRSAGVCRVAAAAERASAGRPPEKVAAEAAAAEATGGRGSVGGRASSSVAGTERGRRCFPWRPRSPPLIPEEAAAFSEMGIPGLRWPAWLFYQRPTPPRPHSEAGFGPSSL